MFHLMLYNIYRGGEGRLDKLVEVVNASHPDFLGILEAVKWGTDDERILKEFAKNTAFSFYEFAKSNTKYDVALLGDIHPLRVKKFSEGFWHGAMLAEFVFPKIGNLALFLFHLDPRREENRKQELARLCTLAQSYSNVILMGDFNSLSPHDPYDHPALLRLLNERGIEKFGTERLQFDCIEYIESLGFIDVMRALKKSFAHTVPTPENEDENHAAPLRLDYVFISAGLRQFLKDAIVLKTPLTDITSDHYPLIVDFSF